MRDEKEKEGRFYLNEDGSPVFRNSKVNSSLMSTNSNKQSSQKKKKRKNSPGNGSSISKSPTIKDKVQNKFKLNLKSLRSRRKKKKKNKYENMLDELEKLKNDSNIHNILNGFPNKHVIILHY